MLVCPKKKYKIIILVVFIHIQFTGSLQIFDCDSEVIFAQTVCDHGDATIGETYPNDPYKSRKYWPEGYLQLTKLGKQQCCELGTQLKERYRRLLVDETYTAEKAYFFSTDDDRVLSSASTCAAGFFPPRGYEIWNKSLDWQPIPIHSVPINEDNILAYSQRCDRYDALNSVASSMMYYKLMEQYGPLIKYMEIHSGEQLSTMQDLKGLYQTLYVEQYRGYELPQWAQFIMGQGDFINALSGSSYVADTYTTELKKLKSGYLLKSILDYFTNKTKSTLDLSLRMSFGHESVIGHLLNSLGIHGESKLDYASCLLFELYECRKEFYVQINYKNDLKNPSNTPALHIPKCGKICPLQKMYELYKPILPTRSYEEECNFLNNQPKHENFHFEFEFEKITISNN